ncbi:MAG TPA: hypothetical protein VME17_12460 [Bryobacteraceae bacterium]|nr:hypothetical protein [Bryobacteraceae bacterium]
MDQSLAGVKIKKLREGIRANRISFPSQVPVFQKHDRADLQRKAVLLYFVFGWSCRRIGARYGLRRQRVQQILNTWTRRAVETGYVQTIPPEQALPLRLTSLHKSCNLQQKASPIIDPC